MVCYKQSSTLTQNFRESKLHFSRFLWVLHEDQIETIVHPGLLQDKDDVVIPRSTGLIVGFFFNTLRQKIAPALIS